MDEHLKSLVNGSITVIREAKAMYKNPAILFAGGKDSTVMLHLVKEACFGNIDMPLSKI